MRWKRTRRKRVVEARDALSFQEVPQRLVVIGGGYNGLELSSVYAKLGARSPVDLIRIALAAGLLRD